MTYAHYSYVASWRIILLVFSSQLLNGADSATEAYGALQRKDYETAVAAFRRALTLEPEHIEYRKELAYALMKMGETAEARDEFAQIVLWAPRDWHSAIEYAYLCHETGQTVQARRIFDQVRKQGDPDSRRAAEQAFHNVDTPLEAAIQRWSAVVAQTPGDFSAHVELARAAEARDNSKVAAQHYLLAWQLRPQERALLVPLGRTRKLSGDEEGAVAAWLVASRSSNPRAAEQARDLLPNRYPYASEFQKALAMDPANVELRRELAFLWLAVNKPSEAEMEFQQLLRHAPDDLLTLAQLGLMMLARNDVEGAMKLLDKVLAGNDEALATKVRKALEERKLLKPRAVVRPERPSHKAMGDKSYGAGYLKDAERYYQAAREENPQDPEINLKLGRTYNMLRQDDEAIRYFEQARHSTSPEIKGEAEKSFRALRKDTAKVKTTTWLFPLFSSRWHTAFTYGQLKSEWRLGKLPVTPYASLRFVGDSQRAAGALTPQYLSESSFILGLGVRTKTWRGAVAWAEAGNAVRYRERNDVGRAIPDYRGGISFARAFGSGIGASEPGWFFESLNDVVTLSRFQWNLIAYSQNRIGYTLPQIGLLQWQGVWNINLTTDRKREPWANFSDTGPGIRIRMKGMPPSMHFSVDFLHGFYWIQKDNPRPPTYRDFRAGVWYAFTR